METKAYKAYWHIHHELLLEYATEPIENRVAYIKAHKPKEEVETRLRLLKPIQGVLPDAIEQQGIVLANIVEEYDNAQMSTAVRSTVDTGLTTHFSTLNDLRAMLRNRFDAELERFKRLLWSHEDALNSLHKAECPNCPWDGKTIFPKAEEQE